MVRIDKRDEKRESVVSAETLGAFASDTARQLDILGHDGHALGVDGAKVGILEQTDQVSLRRFLQSADGGGLESQVSLEILSNFTDQTLERQFADQELGGLLVSPDLTKSDSSGPVAMGLLHTTRGWCALPGSLGGELLPGSLSSRRFSGGLLGTCHDLRCESRLLIKICLVILNK